MIHKSPGYGVEKGAIMSNINIVREGGVLSLTLNRPEKRNALTRQMYQELADAFDSVASDVEIKVIRIQGAGESFTAGNDIQDFASRTEHDSVSETAAFMRALLECHKPVVAQVHGMAVGIGTTLLLHCDLVYCSPQTHFVLPFINLGLVPEYASSYLLPRLAGRRKASEWLMLGEPFGAQDALQFGLVSQVVEDDRLEQMVSTVCASLVAKPAFALNQTKALMTNEADAIAQHMNTELDVFLEAMGTEAAKEAFDAFLNKRRINPEKFR